MAYDRYATQFTDKDGNVYGVMDEEAREDKAPVICPTASGAIASFPDGADGLKLRELNVAVEPVQDLHGYDAPWPAGGGKNLLEITAETKTLNGVTYTVNRDGAGNVVSVSLTGTSTGASELMLNSAVALPDGGIVTGAESHATSGSSYRIRVGKTSDNSYVINDIGSGGNIPALSGDTYNVKILVDGVGVAFNYTLYPMIRPASVSDASFAPYSNICPISGHANAVVTRTGKNLLQKLASGSVFGVTMTSAPDGSVSFSGTVTSNDAIYYASNGWLTLPAGTYILSGGVETGIAIRIGKDALGGTYVTQVADTPASFTLTEETAIRVGLRIQNRNGQSVSGTFYPMIRRASETDGTYEPYQGLSVTIPFGQTVYGGNLTLHQDGSGELVVDRACVDLGTINWYDTDDAHVFRGYVALKAPGIGNFLCQNYVWSGTAATAGNCTMCGVATSPNVYIRDDAYSDAAAFKTAMSGVQLVYELATPVTISLTASQITTLLGHNNIFADCGDVSVTYPADTKLYIDGQQTEDDMTANTNIPNGYYFQVGNTLYKATAAIAQGETIIPGTNCTRTTFAEALNLLAAQ